MAHNTRVRADSPWTTVVLGTELQQLDTYAFESINGDQGGTWAPATKIIVGGEGIQVTGVAIFDDLQDCHVKYGEVLLVDSGGHLGIQAGGELEIYGELQVEGGGTIEVETGCLINVNDGGEINFKDGSILDLEDGAEAHVLSGAELRSDAGSTVQLNGFVNITGETTIASGTDVTFAGTSNYPKLGSRSEWLPCSGCYGTPTPDYYADAGWNLEVTVDTSQVAHYRVAVPGHYTITEVKVQWQGATHSTFPPENRVVFSVFKVDDAGASTLLASQADTSDKATYESYHSVTISGFSETFGPEEYLLIYWFNEYGTNAESGGRWFSSQMYATFAELRNT